VVAAVVADSDLLHVCFLLVSVSVGIVLGQVMGYLGNPLPYPIQDFQQKAHFSSFDS
jgi:hypothetical protein